MKKKIILIIIGIIMLAGLVIAAIYLVRKDKVKYYEPEKIDAEVFNEEESEYDSDLMIGLWQDSTVYYRKW